MFKKAACCKKCNEQYSLPKFSLSEDIEYERTCPKCTENQRESELLTHQTALEKEKNEAKRLVIQQTYDRRRLDIELEKEKRITLSRKQQYDQKEAEKRRFHEMEMKKSETTLAEKKIEAEKELKKSETEHKMQMDRHRHEAEMIDKQLKHEADMKDKEHRHEAQMQDKRNEELRFEVQRLILELRLKESGAPKRRQRLSRQPQNNMENLNNLNQN